jgi:hypothetical protein
MRMSRASFSLALTLVLLASAAVHGFADPVLLPVTITGAGASWEVNNSGGTNTGTPAGTQNFSPGLSINDVTLSGQGDAFDFGLQVWIDDQLVAATDDAADQTGQTVTVGPNAMSGLDVTVAYSAMAASPTLRTLVTLTNAGTGDATVDVAWISNLGSDATTAVFSSSDGDSELTTDDRWVVTNDTIGADLTNGFVLYGPGTPAVTPSAVSQVGPLDGPGGSNRSIVARYTVTVPAGETRHLLFYNVVRVEPVDVVAAMGPFNGNPTGELVAGLDTAALDRVVNWSFAENLPPPSPGAVATRFDFDGDGKADLGVYRQTTAEWLIFGSATGFAGPVLLGGPGLGDVSVPHDYDGDGKTDLAVYRTTTGEWFVFGSSTGFTGAVPLGCPSCGDVPVPADYDGDGKADLAVYRPGSAEWFIFGSATGFPGPVLLGGPGLGDVPVPADYDGDGKTDLAVYRPGSAEWFIFGSATGFNGAVPLGSPGLGDTPVAADYDGDGKADLAVYRPGSAEWFIFGSSTGFNGAVLLGGPGLGDRPVPADYDGDGKTDLAVFRTTTGEWFIFGSATGFGGAVALGAPALGDTPLQGR